MEDELAKAKQILESVCLGKANAKRASPLGQFLAANNDEYLGESFEVYFNRNCEKPQLHGCSKEQIDIQVQDLTFNVEEWSGNIHKLAELLLLRGVSLNDLERLKTDFDRFSGAAA